MVAQRLPEENDKEREDEYYAILQVFEKLLDSASNDMDSWEILEELMALRSEFAIRHALRGFDMDYSQAIELLRNYDDLPEEEKARRDILVAAVDNLVDFAVAEEYQMVSECMDIDADGFKIRVPEHEDLLAVCVRYNYRYAHVENMDIEYAMIIAAGLVLLSDTTVLTFMTQGDERVRPWHMQYEGFSAPKSQFPAWLVPPIENRCRCFLESDGISASIKGVLCSSAQLERPEWFNPVFSECVAFGGRIFSDAHRYFQIDSRHKDRLQSISLRIKNKIYGK